MFTNFLASKLYTVPKRKNDKFIDVEDNTNYLESEEIHISQVVQAFFYTVIKGLLIAFAILLLAALFVDIGKLMYLLT